MNLVDFYEKTNKDRLLDENEINNFTSSFLRFWEENTSEVHFQCKKEIAIEDLFKHDTNPEDYYYDNVELSFNYDGFSFVINITNFIAIEIDVNAYLAHNKRVNSVYIKKLN